MIRAVPILLTAVCVCSAAPVPADEAVPDSATIHAKIAAAAGPLPSAYRETYATTSSDGTTTIEHDTRRGTDYHDLFDVGPFHSERGFSKGQAWHQNDNGQTVLDQPDPGRATRELSTTTVTCIHTPFDAYVIARLNKNGYGTKEYIDRAAWRVVRREQITANGTIATTYDDVRLDHGRTFSHHWHTENAFNRTTSDTRVTEYDPSDVGDAEVAIPAPRRALVTFTQGNRSVTLPAQFGPAHVYVRVTINGRGLDFVLDTGADGITIDSTVAKELGLPMYAERSAVTAGRYTTARTIVPEMHVGDLVMHDVAVQVVPQGWQENGGTVKAVGLLGFDFLAELGVTIDYEHRRVTVVPGEDYTPPSDPRTIPLDIRIGGGQPLATVAINGAIGERWVLDTGGAGTFLIFDYFARRHPEALHDEGAGFREGPLYFHGIGGGFDTRSYQIAKLQLASVTFRDFVGYRVISKGSYAENADGLIGPTFLRLFIVGLDYGDSRIYLVPDADGRAAMRIRR